MSSMLQATSPPVPTPVKLMTLMGEIGLGSPSTRVGVGFAVITALEFLLQPSYMFDSFGLRPWKVTSPDDSRSTSLPWFVLPLIGGFAFGFFV
jgi:hypothetical protein